MDSVCSKIDNRDFDFESDSEYSIGGVSEVSESENLEDRVKDAKKILDKLSTDPLFLAMQNTDDIDDEQKKQIQQLNEEIDKLNTPKTILTKRDTNVPIKINYGWEWKFDENNFRYIYEGMTFDDISALCGSKLNFIRNKISITHFYDAHFGVQKYVHMEEIKTGIKFRAVAEESGQFYFEMDDKPSILLSDDDMHDVIKTMTRCDSEEEFDDFVQYIFDKDIIRQTVLVILYAFTTSVCKMNMGLITYVKN